jgi:hypothetical protein
MNIVLQFTVVFVTKLQIGYKCSTAVSLRDDIRKFLYMYHFTDSKL